MPSMRPGEGLVAFYLLKNALDGGAFDVFEIGSRPCGLRRFGHSRGSGEIRIEGGRLLRHGAGSCGCGG